jgi:RNA polymerase sigma factor (sigma-70 family)
VAQRSNIVVMGGSIDDERLVKQFSQGDDSAFDRIVEGYSADIGRLANRLLGWPGDVEDVVQDIFFAVFLGLKKFRGDCSLKTWLFTITVNKCRRYRYRRMLRLRAVSKAGDNIAHTAGCDRGESAMGSEAFDRVRRAVVALPAKYQEAVVLRYLQELSTDEVSRILSISENALQVRLSRARRRLRQELAELMEP